MEGGGEKGGREGVKRERGEEGGREGGWERRRGGVREVKVIDILCRCTSMMFLCADQQSQEEASH